MPAPTVFASSSRILLREIVDSDSADMFELDNDPEVHRFLGNKPVQHIDEAKNVIAFIRKQYLENGIGRWAVIEKSTGEFIGWAGLKWVKEETNGHVNFFDVGYRLKRKFWGKGFATEACKASLDYGFKNLNAKEIFASADSEHNLSIRVLEKCGLKYLSHYLFDGRKTNWYRVLREEWLLPGAKP